MLTGSREQAFVSALSSAALAQKIGRACTRGVTKQCGCGAMPHEPPPDGQFAWGGCGDAVGFSSIFSRLFANAAFEKKPQSKTSLVNTHNNAVGRVVRARVIAQSTEVYVLV